MTVARAECPREDAPAECAPDEVRFRIPSMSALLVAVLLGVAGGATAAFWMTLIEAKGLFVGLGF